MYCGGGGGGGLYGGGAGSCGQGGGGGGCGSNLVPAAGSAALDENGAEPQVTISYTVPTVSSVSPDAGLESGWTAVAITGTGLSEAKAVKFGSTNAVYFEINSSTSITAISPAGTGTVPVEVTNPTGTSITSPADEFTYVAPGPGPGITKLSAKRGPAAGGTPVTITGTSFAGVTAVKFGSTEATSFTVNSPTSISAVSPAGTTGTVEVHVTTPNGESTITSNDRFTYEAPTVTHVSPGTGSKLGDTPVTVNGSGFAPGSGTTVFVFGKGIALAVNCITTSECTMLSPAAAKTGTVDITAKVNKKTSTKNPADEFTYN